MQIVIDDRDIVLVGKFSSLCALPSRRGTLETAKSFAAEEVLVASAVVEGEVRSDGRGFNAAGRLYALDGEEIGKVELSWETTAQSAEELRAVPPAPRVRADEPGPLPRLQPVTYAQAQWSFRDGSTLTAVGSGFSRVYNTSPSTASAADAVAMRVTSATGRFEGLQGLITLSGSVDVRGDSGFFNRPGARAAQHLMQTFRLSRP